MMNQNNSSKYMRKYLDLKSKLNIDIETCDIATFDNKLFFSNQLLPEHKEYLYNMYVSTYGQAGNILWFKSVDELFNPAYTCGIIIDDELSDILNIKAYSIFQKKRYVNKLSITCHDGTKCGKKLAVKLRIKYANMPNWIIEASGATAWLLRKNNTPYISDIATIKKLLDIDGIKEDIELNPDFNIDDFKNIDNPPINKSLFHYYHIYIKENGSEIRNKETLFGISGCDNFNNNSCNRECID